MSPANTTTPAATTRCEQIYVLSGLSPRPVAGSTSFSRSGGATGMRNLKIVPFAPEAPKDILERSSQATGAAHAPFDAMDGRNFFEPFGVVAEGEGACWSPIHGACPWSGGEIDCGEQKLRSL